MGRQSMSTDLPEAFCQVCGGSVKEFLDLGRQPLSDHFLSPEQHEDEYFYQLAVGVCQSCGMVQAVEQVPRELMFREDYPYYSSGSQVMREHFTRTAEDLLEQELTGPSPFVVEVGCNDGVMLRRMARDGVHHLGFEPSGRVATTAASHGVQVRTEFFDEDSASRVRTEHGPANVIYAANTLCHIPYVGSVLRGAETLLAENGVFVFEDPYVGDIVAKNSFDQIYDEHFYFFGATSVRAMARSHHMELVDVKRLPVHGGEIRYTLARQGEREPSPAVDELIGREQREGLTDHSVLRDFADRVHGVRRDLTTLLRDLRDQGSTVAAYGATAKSATVTNYCGIGPDLVSSVYDSTPAKQGRLTPGARLPVLPSENFGPPYPDYALLFAWNHAEEIMAREKEFRARGGRWILYVPKVQVI